MKRFILSLTLICLVAGGCYRDNASPMVHGADSQPGAGGDTTLPAPGANESQAPREPGAEAQTTTYGQSGGNPGGSQTTTGN
jgi:hypothetical protein